MRLVEYVDLLENAWYSEEPCVLSEQQAKELVEHVKALVRRLTADQFREYEESRYYAGKATSGERRDVLGEDA